MPRDTDKECPCCGEKVSASAIRRHLRGQTTKSVLVAQEHSYGQQRRRLLRLEAVASDPTEATIDSSMDVIVHDEDVPMDRDLELPDSQHSDTLGEDGGRDGSESESDGDPFEGRPEEIFWEDSDEEDDVALGGDFQAAPWLQGLSAEQRLEEIFNVDAAQRDVAQLSQIKLLYGLTAELDLSAEKDMDDTGLAFEDYVNLRMVYPHRTLAVDAPLRNKIAAYLTTNYDLSRSQALKYLPTELSLWGKLKMLGGGDLIHAWDLFTLEVDKNRNRRNMPVVLRRQTFFGQVRKFIALTVPTTFPARRGAGEEERTESARERTIVLAAIAKAKVTRRNPAGMVYFDAKSTDLGPASEVIDVEMIDCLAGRIRDSKRWACLLRPEVAAKFKLIEEGTAELN
ncbi:hypothetical protein B0H17DRAFT_1136769 [Mycena rosella]|uniref:Uncharacterized protein n=1 Tax=Mycena rosella TaxID=1033263 RepID=A0AAD7D9Y7_MYCRO|nr:hypothetical protein B0H17DRAFT_1136769 [Mycena rosella]